MDTQVHDRAGRVLAWSQTLAEGCEHTSTYGGPQGSAAIVACRLAVMRVAVPSDLCNVCMVLDGALSYR